MPLPESVKSFGPIAAPNGAYSLSVRAGNGVGFGPESNVVNITVPTLPAPPGTPTGLVVNVSGNSATFTWVAPASGGPVANYVLIAGQTPGFVTPLATLVRPATPTAAVVNGVPPGIWYGLVAPAGTPAGPCTGTPAARAPAPPARARPVA